MTDPPGLDAAIHAVASSSKGPADLNDTLIRITDIARGVPGAAFASVTILHGSGRLETVAPSSPLMYVADGLQYELNEGPCYDAVTDDGIIYCPDLAHDSRWPEFGPRASTLGLGSLLAVRLAHPGATHMALNMYADDVGAFREYEATARLFLSRGQAADEPDPAIILHAELNKRAMVDHATGILMHQHGIDAEHALRLLNELAQQRESEPGD